MKALDEDVRGVLETRPSRIEVQRDYLQRLELERDYLRKQDLASAVATLRRLRERNWKEVAMLAATLAAAVGAFIGNLIH